MKQRPHTGRLGVCAILFAAALALGFAVPATGGDSINGEWVQLHPTDVAVPEWRKYFAAIYDPVRDRLIINGKWPFWYGDTWALSLSDPPTWTELLPGGEYSGRAFHAGIYDPPRDRMLIYGGNEGPFFYVTPDVDALPLNQPPAWSTLLTAGTLPAGRLEPSLIYDPPRERMLVFGGRLDASTYTNQLWALTLSGIPTWSLLTPAGSAPSPRIAHSAIYDPLRDRMIVFGGRTTAAQTTEVWELALSGTPTWNLLTTAGTPPEGRYRHSAIYDPVRDRMVVYAGFGPGNVIENDLWALSLAGTPTWTQLQPAGVLPAEREGHRAIYDPIRDRMVVYGGQYPPEDLWALNWGTPLAVEPSVSPSTLFLRLSPSPMVTNASVEFSLPREGRARVAIYDVRGALVRTLMDGPVTAGLQRLRWNRTTESGQRAPSGVFFLRLESTAGRITRRFALIH